MDRVGDSDVGTLVDRLFRTQYGRLVAILSSAFGFRNLQIAEDIVQETLIAAFNHWSYGAVPEQPAAWLVRVARNKALNYLKHESRKQRLHRTIRAETDEEIAAIEVRLGGDIEDAMLRMIFACCHPVIAKESQIALILKTLGGFGTDEIARALLVGREAVNKRIYRAKQAIKQRGIRLDVPTADELDARLGVVCTTLYLLYNEGYNATHAEAVIRRDLCLEAMRLTRLLCRRFPQHPEVFALLALMCFHTARFDSRIDDRGALVLFAEQDRRLWDGELIEQGTYYLTESARGSRLTAYHLEASIAAHHCFAVSFADTDWHAIRALYESLYELKPNPIVQLNLAIVAGCIGSRDRAIEILEALTGERKLERFAPLHAALGEFYTQAGDFARARRSLETALASSTSPHHRAHLAARLTQLSEDDKT